MEKQKIILKYAIIGITAVAALVLFYFLFRWVFADTMDVDDDALAVFAANTDLNFADKAALDEYSGNFFVHILNQMLPSAKVQYEKHYKEKMGGMLTASIKNITKNAELDLSNPGLYLRFVYSAFGQFGSNALAVANIDNNQTPLNISSFEEAPEGTIYFTEEDEYKAEQQNSQDITSTAAAASDNTNAEGSAISEVEAPDKIDLSKKSPEILIYHTHTSESYMPVSTGNYHTIDENYNVVAIGNIISDVLEKDYSYKVVHSKTYHDIKSYGDSYINSLNTIKDQMTRNKSLKVVLDVHRDAYNTNISEAAKKEKKNEYTVKINGKNAARIMLVVGKDNPNYEEVKKFAVYIQKKMEKLYPGLFLKTSLVSNRKYNEYLSDYSMLLEVGCSFNTIDEAKYSAELLGNVMGEVLKDLGE